MPTDAKHTTCKAYRLTAPRAIPAGTAPPGHAVPSLLESLLSFFWESSPSAYRLFSSDVPEVEIARATAESADVGGIVLSASGYIVAHHKINVNSKVTGLVQWIGVEKGDKVKEGQVLVRLQDEEFRAQYEQAKGAADSAHAYLEELQHGSRPQEIAPGPAQSRRSPSHACGRQSSRSTAPKLSGRRVSSPNNFWMTPRRSTTPISSVSIRSIRASN